MKKGSISTIVYLVGSENGYAAIRMEKHLLFRDCHFNGQVMKTYFSPLIIDINGDEQTEFKNCTFNGNYTMKSMNHQTVK
ncbi:MAG: hypothetical protein IPP86_02505 [Bacteroidetes bacterium]|nr:hypothetical protein [Bacteroidota bacterium]